MHPSQLEQLVRDHQADLLSARGPKRRPGSAHGRLMYFTRKGLQKTGLGLIRVGLRMTGPEPLQPRPQSGGVGIFESSS